MITNILAAIFVLGLLVFVHELGHFMAAKRVGIKVERFSLGFPPKMIGKTVGDTEYCISWVPLGGYVKMAGEHPDSDEVRGEPWEFHSKPLWARAFVIAAGPAMNVLLAFLVLWGLLCFVGIASIDTTAIGKVAPQSPFAKAGLAVGDRIDAINRTPVKTWEDVVERFAAENISQFHVRFTRAGAESTTVIDFRTTTSPQERFAGLMYFMDTTINVVNPGSPAAAAGLQVGDRITSVDGQPISQWTDMVDIIRKKPGQVLTITWARSDQPYQAQVTTEVMREVNAKGDMENIGRIGVGKEYYRSKPVGVFRAFGLAGLQTAGVIGKMISFVKQLVSRDVSAKLIGGPIFIAQVAGDTARRGVESLFNFIAFLSINLAILNILPIPALDGGQLLILAVEGLIRRPLTLRQRMVWQQIGMAILALIMAFVIVNDVSRLLR
ncbi:MAG: RIP metalloprotease RseP [Candidatus Latescibacteria bacterium]|nr:RIP metalloprotease RseP [Candidatus Latescibacterota bacterium]